MCGMITSAVSAIAFPARRTHEEAPRVHRRCSDCADCRESAVNIQCVPIKITNAAYVALQKVAPGALEFHRPVGATHHAGWMAGSVRVKLLAEQKFGESLSDVLVRAYHQLGWVL